MTTFCKTEGCDTDGPIHFLNKMLIHKMQKQKTSVECLNSISMQLF